MGLKGWFEVGSELPRSQRLSTAVLQSITASELAMERHRFERLPAHHAKAAGSDHRGTEYPMP